MGLSVSTDQRVILDDATLRPRVQEWLNLPWWQKPNADNPGHIGNWDVSRVTDMSKLFFNAKTFNDDISAWDVSNVTNMTRMFYFAETFNQPIGEWDVSSVTDMHRMFMLARAFDQPIGQWNVSRVTDMSYMFHSAQVFNQPIGQWDVSSVTDMHRMFDFAETFNQPIGRWDVSSAKYMDNMFHGAKAFNQSIDAWDVSKVSDMCRMFSSDHGGARPEWYILRDLPNVGQNDLQKFRDENSELKSQNSELKSQNSELKSQIDELIKYQELVKQRGEDAIGELQYVPLLGDAYREAEDDFTRQNTRVEETPFKFEFCSRFPSQTPQRRGRRTASSKYGSIRQHRSTRHT